MFAKVSEKMKLNCTSKFLFAK